MKVFIDTNILIDFVCAREGFFAAALQVFSCFERRMCEGSASALSFITACYVAKRYNLSQEQMARTLLEVAKFIDIEPLTPSVLHTALASGWKDKEDAAQYHSAIAAGADILMTRDTKHFEGAEDIAIMTPERFIAEYNLSTN